MIPFVLLAPLGSILFYVGLVAAQRQTQRFERVRREWMAYGARRGLRYSLATIGLHIEPVHRLEGDVQSLPLKVGTGYSILDSMTTTVTGHAALPVDGRVYVYMNPVFSQAAEVFDVKRVHLADDAFDGGTFVVEATDEAIVRTVLAPPVRRALLAMSQCGRQSLNFHCAGHELVVEWLGDEALPELFDQACELIALAGDSRHRTCAYR